MNNENLKNLAEFKDIIHRCSKCGICQDACPLYKITGNECTVSRGQFIMLNGIIKGDLKLNKTINKYLNLCLKCNKCTNFCPSEINALDIILNAKADYFKNSFEGKLYGFLESKYIFGTILSVIGKICSVFTPKYKSKTFDTKAVYFGGCVNKLHPNVNNYVSKLLNTMEIETIDTDFDCCGMPFLTTGNKDRFIEVLENNISKLSDNLDYIVTDCASCNWAWKQYSKYTDNKELKAKLEKIKIISIYDLIIANNVKFKSKKNFSVTYHKPCHEENNNCTDIIRNIENIEYKQMEGYDKCCGFASFEYPQNIKTISPIYKEKKNAIINTKADITLTSCVGCLISLKIISGIRTKINRLITFLMNNTEII